AKGRRALGRADETAPSPPTRTKSSISVVTNKTLKNSCPSARAHLLLCKNGSSYPKIPMPHARGVRSVKTFLLSRRHLGSAHQQQRTSIVPKRPKDVSEYAASR